MPAPVCDKCHRRISGTVYRSPTARPLCARCHEQLNGMVLGYMSGGTQGAIAGPSILSWVRKALGRDKG